MLINGEKWACVVCIRGHRTSTCQHNDGILKLIRKKGRPVSQCGHCRFLRKSRSIHKQCHYLDRTHFEVDICCCIYSGQFSCIIEKPHIPPIREFLHNIAYNEPPLLGIDADRLRLGTVKSDGRYLVEQQAKRDQEQKELSSREGIFSQVARTSNDMALHEF